MDKKLKEIANNGRKKALLWFQDNLYYIRFMSNLTLDSISRDTGISKQTLSLIENKNSEKNISYYQYLVIRQYIEIHIISRLSYFSEFGIELCEMLSLATAYIAITVGLDDPDMCGANIFGEYERRNALIYWDELKTYIDSCKNDTASKTSKTFFKRLLKEISNETESIDATKLYTMVKDRRSILLTPGAEVITVISSIDMPHKYRMILFSYLMCNNSFICGRPLIAKKYLESFIKCFDPFMENLNQYVLGKHKDNDSILNDSIPSIDTNIIEWIQKNIHVMSKLALIHGVRVMYENNNWNFAQTYDGIEKMSLKSWEEFDSYAFLLGYNSALFKGGDEEDTLYFYKSIGLYQLIQKILDSGLIPNEIKDIFCEDFEEGLVTLIRFWFNQ